MNVEISALNINRIYQSHPESSEGERKADAVVVFIQGIDPLNQTTKLQIVNNLSS